MTDDGGVTGDVQSTSSFTASDSDRLINQIKNRRFRGWLYPSGPLDFQAGEQTEVFVVGHQLGARTEATGLVLSTRSIWARFKEFRKHYKVGQQIAVSPARD